MIEINVMILPDGRLSAKEAAKYIGIAHKSLATMRSNNDGPKFVKLGRIFYYKKDLDEWIEKRRKYYEKSSVR